MNRLHYNKILGFLSLLCIHLQQDHETNQLVWDSFRSVQGILDEPNHNNNNNNRGRPNRHEADLTVVQIVDGKPWLDDRIRPPKISFCNKIHNKSNTSVNVNLNHHQQQQTTQQQRNCGINATVTAQNRIIDYAILGFAKCGSTTVGTALGKIGQSPRGDTCLHIRDIIERSYEGWKRKGIYGSADIPLRRKNQNVLTGIKCPAGIDIDQILKPWAKYQPQTLLIFGIRHPVSSFESFYNHLVQRGWKFDDPHNVALPRCQNKKDCSERGCPKDRNKVLCMDRLRYHVALAKLGKTPLGDQERQLLPFNGAEIPFQPIKVPNKVFLYEVSQLSDTTGKRDELFWSDLSTALELPRPIHIHPQNVTSVKPGLIVSSSSSSNNNNTKVPPPIELQRRAERRMDICSPENDDIREVLMKYSRQAADWICPYFLGGGDENNNHNNTGVIVSDRDYFCNVIMERWKHDPCDDKGSSRTTTSNNHATTISSSNILKMRTTTTTTTTELSDAVDKEKHSKPAVETTTTTVNTSAEENFEEDEEGIAAQEEKVHKLRADLDAEILKREQMIQSNK